MSNATIIRILGTIATVCGTFVTAALACPSLKFPPVLIAGAGFLSFFCLQLAKEFVQVKGVSDEAQGISPAQQAVQAQADAAIAAHASVPPPTTPPPAIPKA
jgi:hypothetical protein